MEFKAKLNIPIGVAQYVIVQRLEKPFQVYINLLATTNGVVDEKVAKARLLTNLITIKDKRTVEKYLQQLIQLNWIGHDLKSGIYYIRSLTKIHSMLQLNGKKVATFYTKNIYELKPFLVAAVISDKINRIKSRKRFAMKQSKSATVNRDVALQDLAVSCDNYFGISLKAISEMFQCSHGKASELKTMAEEAGFLIVKKRFKTITVLNKADYFLREQLNDVYKGIQGRIRFKESNGKVAVMIQTIDEIIPRVQIKKVRKLQSAQD